MHHVILDGGLDQVSAAPAVLPGAIRDCLNYEVGFRRGLTRIDGLERFDGRTSPSSTNAWRYYVPNADITGTFTELETLTWTLADRSGESGVLVDMEVGATDTGLYIFFRSTTSVPPDGATITGDDSGAYFVVDTATHDIRKLSDYYGDHQSYLTALNGFATTLRGEVREVPGTGNIVGLHHHEDKLYAVRDSVVFEFVDNSSNWAPLGGGTLYLPGAPLYQVGDVVNYDASVSKMTVHALSQAGFDVAASDYVSACCVVRFSAGSGTVPEVGDTLTGDTSNFEGLLVRIDVRNGSFDAGNAEGIMAFINGNDETADDTLEAAEDMTGTGVTCTVDAVYSEYYYQALQIVSVDTQSETAQLWESSDTGWQQARVGRRVDFISGTVDPTGLVDVDTNTGAKLPTSATISSPLSTRVDWTGSAGTNNPSPLLTDNPGVTYIRATWAESGSVYNQSETITLQNFKPELKNEDVVTGFEVIISAKAYAVAGGTGGQLRIYRRNDGSNYYATVRITSTSYTTYTIGGPTNRWGMSRLDANVLNASDFQFFLYTRGYYCDIEINYVAIKIYYRRKQAQARMYVRDVGAGTDIGWIQIDKAVLTNGDWDGSGEGYFQVYDWSDPDFPAGTKIYTSPSGAGSLVAELSTAMNYPTLPGSLLLDDYNSRYQFISHAFDAGEDSNYIYGVSGAGRAFVYDGQSLVFVDTGLDEKLDKPRHIAAHQGRLALGYDWGEVYISSITSPLEFDAVTLASTHGFGSRVTGLQSLNGDSMAVFCESKIEVIYGTALDSDGTGVDQKVLSANSGAIEYTVQMMGSRPIFADFRGISTIDAVDTYGDFSARPLSYNVTPWLVERLQRKSGYETTDRKVVNSVVVRNKSQYRLFFADGYVLTLTLVGADMQPQNTIQRYWLENNESKYLRVYATAVGVTSDGRDRVFVSAANRYDTDMSASAGYVYELDRGNTFDGTTIRAYFELAHYFAEEPAGVHRWNRTHLHGYAAGHAALHISRALNYEPLDDTVLPYEPAPFGSLSAPPQDTLHSYYAPTRLSGRGFAVTLRVDHASALEFPHTIQMFSFVDDEPMRVHG